MLQSLLDEILTFDPFHDCLEEVHMHLQTRQRSGAVAWGRSYLYGSLPLLELR
jgi:hypothetical protein